MKRTFVIAEAGVNHNGDLELARDLVRAAARSGADAVKFQSFSADKVVAAGTETAEYQRRNAGETDQLSMLRRLELSRDAHFELAEVAAAAGIEFLSSPFDEGSVDLLCTVGVRRFKISSGEITNYPLLERVAAAARPIILSTGMSTLDEVSEAVARIGRVRSERGFEAPIAEVLTLLHCTSNYPAAVADVNLLAMHTLARAFSVPIGYSDHTEGTVIAVAAAALGATVIEKHFTLDRKLPGPDHLASIEPTDFARMVSDIRSVDLSLGDGNKAPRPSETPLRELARRSVAAAKALAANHVIAADDLMLLRPGGGLPPADLPLLVGRTLRKAISRGVLISWKDLE